MKKGVSHCETNFELKRNAILSIPSSTGYLVEVVSESLDSDSDGEHVVSR